MVLAVHDTDGDKHLSLAEFGSFMQQFMAAAGYNELQAVLGDLIVLVQNKVTVTSIGGSASGLRGPGMGGWEGKGEEMLDSA